MPPTRREVEAAFPRTTVSKESDPYFAAVLKAAAVSSEKLTGSPEWDRFLEKLQPLLDDAKQSAAMWLERCGGAMSDADVRMAQFNYQACKARVDTLEEVMKLPREIIQAHADTTSH